MRLLLDEMYPATIAEQLKARGHDAASIHDPDFRYLEGAPDDHVFEAAAATGRVLITENVSDFRRLESERSRRAREATDWSSPRTGSFLVANPQPSGGSCLPWLLC